MSLETEFLLLGWGLLGTIVVTALCWPREPSRRRKRGRTLLDLIAVTFAALAFAASAWQGWVARDVEKRQLRAYMAVDPMNPKNFAPNAAPSAGAKITVKGQTPAYDVTLVTHLGVLEYPLKEGLDTLNVPPAPTETASTILTPGQSTENHPTLSVTLTPSGFDALKASKQYRLYAWGEVHYTDAFDDKWQNRFCYSLDASDPNATTFDLGPSGNCADAQCG